MDAIARSVGRKKKAGKKSILDKVLGREPGERPEAISADMVLKDTGEDVWKSLRF